VYSTGTYQYCDVGDELDEDELAPEDVEGNVERILSHGSAHHNRSVGLRVGLKKSLSYHHNLSNT